MYFSNYFWACRRYAANILLFTVLHNDPAAPLESLWEMPDSILGLLSQEIVALTMSQHISLGLPCLGCLKKLFSPMSKFCFSLSLSLSLLLSCLILCCTCTTWPLLWTAKRCRCRMVSAVPPPQKIILLLHVCSIRMYTNTLHVSFSKYTISRARRPIVSILSLQPPHC